MRRLAQVLLLSGLAVRAAAAGDAWEHLEESLRFASADGTVHAQLEGLLSLDAYQGAQENPGFVFTDRDSLLSPRLTLFGDAQIGRRLTGFVQVRADRGFDPTDHGYELRLDECAVRLALGDGTACSVQVGSFATVIGNWVPRHDAWQNPFINAPLPYEYMTGLYDAVAPVAITDLLIGEDEPLYEYNPIIWGPSYATGVAVSGRLGGFEYAAELKNTGPSSRPGNWGLSADGFAHPAYNVHLSYRPDLRWRFGVSASDSCFLMPSATGSLPPGTRLGDYRERLFAQDVSFEWRHLQVWAELFETEFILPGLPRARTVAGYTEVRYKFTPEFAGAVRWNRQVFSEVLANGRNRPWTPDVTRLDLAATCRLSPQAQLKVQVSSLTPSDLRGHAGVAYAAQLAVRF